MAGVVIDDHLLRDLLIGRGADRVHDLSQGGIATTGLWYFRLCSAYRRPGPLGRLIAPLGDLANGSHPYFRAALISLPPYLQLLTLRDLAWPMAELQAIHGAEGRLLSAATAEALAAAHELDSAIAVSRGDVGPGLQAAAEADGVPFHIV